MNILCIDDSPLVLKVGEKILQENNFQSLLAKNGEEGLTLLEENEVALIVLDYHMPKMDGLQTLQHIRRNKNKEKANLPVLILSDENNPEIITTLLQAGANDYIHKAWLTHKPMVFMEKIFELLGFEAKFKLCRFNKLEQTLSPIVKNFHLFVKDYFESGLSGNEISVEDIQAKLNDIDEDYLKGEFVEIIYDIVVPEDYLTVHTVNATLLTMMFTHYLNFPKSKILDMMLGALFHDFGNAGIESPIFRNPSGLEEKEFSTYMRHVERGVHIAKILDLPQQSIEFIANHHEKMDGSGFPWRKNSANLSDISQVALIIDSFDSLTFQREEQKRLMVFEALRRMKSWEGQYSIDLLEKFEKLLAEKNIKPDA
ncbi:MAG: response regulator [Nitrospinae bacterium]|nr:response regulator [Nitrospinota bacterium]